MPSTFSLFLSCLICNPEYFFAHKVLFCLPTFYLLSMLLFMPRALYENVTLFFFLGVMSHLHFLNKTGLIEAI